MQKFGYMARKVFEQWGVTKSSDFGEIVFKLVESELMGKTETDTLNDFKDIYDFKEEYDDKFRFDNNNFDLSYDWNIFGMKE